MEALGTQAQTDPGPGVDVREGIQNKASEVRDQASEQVKSVADTAKQETMHVAANVSRGLGDEVRDQTSKLARILDDASDELQGMAANGTGWMSGLADDLAGTVRGIARWMDETEPRDMLGSVEEFARRRPTAFILGSAAAGVLMGRLTRGVMAARSEESEELDTSTTYGLTSPQPAGQGYVASYPTSEADSRPEVMPAGQSESPVPGSSIPPVTMPAESDIGLETPTLGYSGGPRP